MIPMKVSPPWGRWRDALLAITNGYEASFAEGEAGCGEPGWWRDTGGGDDAIAGDQLAAVENQSFVVTAGAS